MYHRRKFALTPRRAAAAVFIALLFAFVASWTSLPARAGGSTPSIAAAAPRHMLAVRTGVVYPLNLPAPSAQASFVRHSRSRRIANPFAYSQRQAAIATDEMLPELPSIATLALTDTPTLASSGFAGLAFPDSQCGPGCEPPQTQVAAGPNNVVEVTNIVGRIFDKSGNDLSDFNLNTFFGVALDIFSSDPRIEYDTLSQRWLISFLTFDNTDITNSLDGFWNLAVSKDSNPLDGFNTYQVETQGDFPDQPPLGFNDDKVVTGGNSFSCDPDCNDGLYEGNEFLVWNKSELLAGAATIDTDFNPPIQDNSQFPIIPAKSRTSTSDALDGLGLRQHLLCLQRQSEPVVGHRRPRRGYGQHRHTLDAGDSRDRSSSGRATEGQHQKSDRHRRRASAGCGFSRRPAVGVRHRVVHAHGRYDCAQLPAIHRGADGRNQPECGPRFRIRHGTLLRLLSFDRPGQR